MTGLNCISYEIDIYNATDRVDRVPMGEDKFGSLKIEFFEAKRYAFEAIFIWGLGEGYKLGVNNKKRLVYPKYRVVAFPGGTNPVASRVITEIANLRIRPRDLRWVLLNDLMKMVRSISVEQITVQELYLSSKVVIQSQK
jgi:hypothetical protein